MKSGEKVKGEVVKEADENIIFKKKLNEGFLTIIYSKDGIEKIVDETTYKTEKSEEAKKEKPEGKVEDEITNELKEIVNFFDEEDTNINGLISFYKNIIKKAPNIDNSYIELGKLYIKKICLKKQNHFLKKLLKNLNEMISI